MMKIADIPQLIRVGQGTQWDLDQFQDTFARWKDNYGLNLDPEFQRPHVWSEETKIKFIEFILRGGVVQPMRFNSPVFGGETHKNHSDLSEDIVLVDGKQRLNAIMEFIDNKIAVFGGNYLSDFDNPDLVLRSTSITVQVNKLQTKHELYQWYLEMNEGQVAHTQEELDRVRNLMKAATHE